MNMRIPGLLLIAVAQAPLAGQDAVTIEVDAGRRVGAYQPIYSYFGYDEPNYTYGKYGPKLIGELARLSPSTVYVRTHFMLCTGDGTPGLKWGSTNAYTEDASGKPVYDWTITDRIFDTYLKAGAKPFVEIGFMPQALSVKPDPYKPTWVMGGRNNEYSIGWSYPPKDYGKWSELVYQWVRHTVEKYGRAEVESWYWEVWNEPDISYWHGTPEDYDRLYDSAAAGLKRALPTARIGGPATTSPRNPRAAEYLRQFLAHCAEKKTPLDFITYHAKGQPRVIDGHVQMGVSNELNDVARGMETINQFPQYAKLPIVLSEADPEGCAACSARLYPNNVYRNGTLYPAYTAEAVNNIFTLADRLHGNIQGMLTWAFEFEDQPYFDGFRSLATNGIDKPVLNILRMFGLMKGERVRVQSSGAVPVDAILKSGVREKNDVNALATIAEREISAMVWNYLDDYLPSAPAAAVELTVAGVPADAKRVLLRHYRIDEDHSNAYTVWKSMGSPQNPTAEQYARLEAAGQLQLLTSPEWIVPRGGKVTAKFELPREAISLVQVSW
jgi:xylan 1,4-beta-xylosidase